MNCDEAIRVCLLVCTFLSLLSLPQAVNLSHPRQGAIIRQSGSLIRFQVKEVTAIITTCQMIISTICVPAEFKVDARSWNSVID